MSHTRLWGHRKQVTEAKEESPETAQGLAQDELPQPTSPLSGTSLAGTLRV